MKHRVILMGGLEGFISPETGWPEQEKPKVMEKWGGGDDLLPGEKPPIIVGEKKPTKGKPTAAPCKSCWLPDGRYRVQTDDTMWSISEAYLGLGNRWKEIWNIQLPEFRGKRALGAIYTGDVLLMPDEAKDNARKRGFLGGLTTGGQRMAWIVGGSVLAVAVVGGGIWLLVKD